METTKNLRIKKHISLIVHDENTIELRSGVWNPYSHTVIDESKTGNLFKMMSLLDGKLSPGEISKTLGISRAEIESLIDYLQRLGVLETTATTAFQQYIDTVMPILTQTNHSRTLQQQYPILLVGDCSLTKEVYQLLTPSADQIEMLEVHDPLLIELQNLNDDWLHNGFLLAEKIEKFKCWKNKFILFLQNPGNPILAHKLNRLAYHLAIPWLHAAIDGPFLFVGPTIVPNRGACYECFETRITMNLRESASYQEYKKALATGKVYHNAEFTIEPALRSLLASHVTLEALNFILTESAFTHNKVLSIYLPTMEIVFNEVLRVSGCATCGAKPQRDDSQHYFDMKTLLEGEVI